VDHVGTLDLEPVRAALGEARPPFNGMHPGAPEVTVAARGVADVIAAVGFARDNGLELAVRGGGHSIAGLSSITGGVLLDLSRMRAVTVDPDRRLAAVQGGALWSDVDRETQAFGLAAPGGMISDTGVGGLTLGGGYGWLRRAYGLSSDNLVEAQVVGADGVLCVASAETNPDLYWALRGGGGNFGVVTSFTFGLHQVGPLVAMSATFYPLEQIASVLRGWRSFVETAPDEITSSAIGLTFPADPGMPPPLHDRACIAIGAVYVGDPETGLRLTAPLRELGTPVFDMSGPLPYTFVQSGFDGLFPRGTRGYWKSQYLDELSDGAIDALAGTAAERPIPLGIVNVHHMGGALARVAPEATAFAQRSSPYLVSFDGCWRDAGDDARGVAWVRDAWGAIAAYGNGTSYLNFAGRADAGETVDVASGAGPNLRRLAEVKRAYDPDNLFRHTPNVRPA
jgi:FAD/FMN-containing dehydrogenase